MIFVVGSSRSGTTMLGTMLGVHPEVHLCEEVHFFEQFWTPQRDSRFLTRRQAVKLGSRLIAAQRLGPLRAGQSRAFRDEAEELLGTQDQWTAPVLFEKFLAREAHRHGKRLACDHTPRNVFYLDDIFAHYPAASVIVMVRDPRDVLASQKKKWQMRFRGLNQDPIVEAIRQKANYHPVMTSALWQAAVGAGGGFATHPRVRIVRFEDLVAKPEAAVRDVALFLGLAFHPEMLNIPQVNSSYDRADPSRTGVRVGAIGRWERGALSRTEVFLCERTAREGMLLHGYRPSGLRPHPIGVVASLCLLPFKVVMATALNLRRMGSLRDSLRHRWRGRRSLRLQGGKSPP